MRQVRIARRNQQAQQVEITEGTTIRQALESQGLDPNDFRAMVNGQAADMDDILNDGATLALIDMAATANTTTPVMVGKLPGKLQQVEVEGTPTVRAALQAAAIDARGYEVLVNGEPANANTELAQGDTVALIRPVEGNQQLDQAELSDARAMISHALVEMLDTQEAHS